MYSSIDTERSSTLKLYAIQTRSSSKHTVCRARAAAHAISAESTARTTQISARARIASRSGVGVGVGAASTTAKSSFDDDSPRMSQLKVLVDHAVRRHCADCRLRSNSKPVRAPYARGALAPRGCHCQGPGPNGAPQRRRRDPRIRSEIARRDVAKQVPPSDPPY